MVGSASRGHQNQLHYLPELTKKNVLALIVGLQNPTDNLGYAVPGYNTFGFIKKGVANAKKRVIVGCYDHDFLTIKNVIEVSKIYQLKLGIYSKRIHQMIDALVKMQYLDLTNLTVFPLDQVIDYDPNSVIILSGNYDRLFQNTYKVLSGEDSKLTFNPTDHFLLTIVTQPGLEVKEAQVTDDISCLDVSTKKLPHSTLLPIAGREDHRFLVNILKPKYVLPVYGFYKEYISYLEAIGSLIFRKNIIFLYNGERIIFHHKNHVKVVEEKISESYVNTKGVMEISSTILLERQNLNHYGLVAVSFVYDKNNNIFSPPQ